MERYGVGATAHGALGDGTLTSHSTPAKVTALSSTVTAVSVAHYATTTVSGGGHVCARTSDGVVWCWGKNTYGAVGDGPTTTRAAPVPICF